MLLDGAWRKLRKFLTHLTVTEQGIYAFVKWLLKLKKLPAIFYPETTDIYDMKNMPRLCYCIHALSMHMFKLGLAPQIHDLEGQLKFTAEEITAMQDKDIKLIW